MLLTEKKVVRYEPCSGLAPDNRSPLFTRTLFKPQKNKTYQRDANFYKNNLEINAVRRRLSTFTCSFGYL